MTEKSTNEILSFIKKECSSLSDEQICERFVKLAKTVRARENGSILTKKKLEALKGNRINSGRKIVQVPYTLVSESGEIYDVDVEKTNLYASLLNEVMRIEEENDVHIIDRIEGKIE